MASSSSRSTSSDRTEEEWMALQREEVAELEQAATQARNGQKDDQQLNQLIQKTVQNFQDYANQRSRQARIHVSPFFGPTSATPLENSVKWIGGCRPGSYIRFLYALSGLDIESHLTEFLQGKKVGDLGELTSKQMNMIDALQAKTIKEEDKLSSKLASLQEDMVDQPIASKIKNECGNVDEALDEHSRCMAGVMEEADELRINTLKEVVQTILKPLQAVEYLAAAKRMKHCFKIWGKNWGERPFLVNTKSVNELGAKSENQAFSIFSQLVFGTTFLVQLFSNAAADCHCYNSLFVLIRNSIDTKMELLASYQKIHRLKWTQYVHHQLLQSLHPQLISFFYNIHQKLSMSIKGLLCFMIHFTKISHFMGDNGEWLISYLLLQAGKLF